MSAERRDDMSISRRLMLFCGSMYVIGRAASFRHCHVKLLNFLETPNDRITKKSSSLFGFFFGRGKKVTLLGEGDAAPRTKLLLSSLCENLTYDLRLEFIVVNNDDGARVLDSYSISANAIRLFRGITDVSGCFFLFLLLVRCENNLPLLGKLCTLRNNSPGTKENQRISIQSTLISM